MKKYTHQVTVAFLFGCISLFTIQKTLAQVSGVKTIPGDYASITQAVQHLRTVGVSGPTFLELQPGYNSASETFPIKIREIPGNNSTNMLTINPAAGATGLSIISDNSEAIIELIGAYNTIIDGRPGRTGSARELTIRNNSTTGRVINFLDGAVGNSVTYCKLEGSATGSSGVELLESVVVYFGRSNEPIPDGILLENTNNTLSNCVVMGINSPFSVIRAVGTSSVQNAANRIIDNEILNFFQSGIEILQDGGTNWTITGNSIYNLRSRFPYTQFVIYFHPGQGSINNTISGNFIGGQAPLAAGEQWVVGGSGYVSISGIFISAGSVVIENNIIQNIKLETTIRSVSFNGIRIHEGAAQIKGNLIGGTTEANGITLDGGSNSFHGISSLSCSLVSIENNRISNVTMLQGQSYFFGILFRAGSGTVVTGNQVDQVTASSTGPVSFTAISVYPTIYAETAECPASPQPSVIDHNLINNITLSSDDDSASFTGIEIIGVGSEASLLHNNEIYKINVSSPDGVASFAGISINDRIAGNSGNIIGSANEANSIMITGESASANGIRLNNSPDVSISDDIIANITAIGTINPASVNGILFEAGAIAKISGNNVHHLTASETKGIFIQPSNGSSTVILEKNILTGANNNTGTGIETLVASEASLNLIATDNTVGNWQTGILLAAASGATLEQSFQNNAVVANQTGFINNNATPVNATCNWWGHASGPGGAGPGTGDPVGPNVTFSPWATIPTYVAVNAGADQTIYIGYGPTSKTLTVTATICGTPEYFWSTGATTPSIIVSPITTTTYTVTVTDANGHTASDGVTVFVQDARCGKKNEKVKLCHKGTGNQRFTICVSHAEVSGHLGHGDVLGDCVTAAGKTVTSEAGNIITEVKINGEEKIAPQTVLNVYPNPAKNILQLQWNSGLPGIQTIEVMDMQGHTLLNQKFMQVKGSNYRHLSLLGFKSGIYLLKMSSGRQIKTVKLIVVK